MSIKQILLENKFFMIPFLIAVLVAVFFMNMYSLNEGHLFLNQFHNNFFDVFFKYFTDLGDGVMFGVVIVTCLFFRFRIALYAAIVGILVLIIISGISKELLFHDWPRPTRVFDNLGINLHYIDGVRKHMISTFPSGHSATAYGLYGLLALFFRNKYMKFLMFTVAILASFSRVYLSLHFVRDSIVGSAIGVIIAVLVFYYFNKILGKYLILDKSLLNFRK